MKEYGFALLGKLLDFLPALIGAVIIFVIGWFLISLTLKLSRKALVKSHLDISLHAFILTAIRVALFIILGLTCLNKLGIPTASLIAALSAAGLALSLALKDSLANLASGIIILATHPFRVGDVVEISGMIGTVQKIDFFYTSLKTADNRDIHLPNSVVSSEEIINMTSSDSRRLDLNFPIGYNDNVELAKSLISSTIEKSGLALSDPEPIVRMDKYGDSAIEIGARIWVKNENYANLRFYLLEQVKVAFDTNGISIPFPQVDVHVKES